MKGNKTVLVTGSSRGIGKAIAKEFAVEGYNVVIVCKSSVSELVKTHDELNTITPNILALKADLSYYDEAKKVFDKIIKQFGRIDVLVNNAGISYVGLFNTMKPSQWQRVMRNNLDSVFNCTHLALQHMVYEKKGNIINISSMWGKLGASCEAVYSASKGAINSFTKSLAKELAPSNIRVNAVSCGAVNTSMNDFLSLEERLALETEIPLGRFATPKEIADMVIYLASDKSKYITGQVIGVDGGMS